MIHSQKNILSFLKFLLGYVLVSVFKLFLGSPEKEHKRVVKVLCPVSSISLIKLSQSLQNMCVLKLFSVFNILIQPKMSHIRELLVIAQIKARLENIIVDLLFVCMRKQIGCRFSNLPIMSKNSMISWIIEPFRLLIDKCTYFIEILSLIQHSCQWLQRRIFEFDSPIVNICSLKDIHYWQNSFVICPCSIIQSYLILNNMYVPLVYCKSNS